jgi:deoxyribose-phosphate aldolase
MTRRELAALIDHAVLQPEAREVDILAGVEVVLRWGIGHYCVKPTYVVLAAEALHDSGAAVVSVIGFPHGTERTAIKVQAAELAVEEGAGELDLMLNIGLVRSGHVKAVAAEIADVVRAVPGIPVQVTLETAVFTPAGIETSSGFHPAGGATVTDVRLLRETLGPRFGVKAAGGIRSLAIALDMLAAGASRLSTPASAAILSSSRE